MKEEDLKLGMKIKIPKTKRYLDGEHVITNSVVIREALNKNQDFLYYNGKVEGDDNSYMLNDKFIKHDLTGDFFDLKDLEPYEEVNEVKKDLFKVGDWIVNKKSGNIGQITKIDTYICWGEGYTSSLQYLDKSLSYNIFREATPDEIFRETLLPNPNPKKTAEQNEALYNSPKIEDYLTENDYLF